MRHIEPKEPVCIRQTCPTGILHFGRYGLFEIETPTPMPSADDMYHSHTIKDCSRIWCPHGYHHASLQKFTSTRCCYDMQHTMPMLDSNLTCVDLSRRSISWDFGHHFGLEMGLRDGRCDSAHGLESEFNGRVLSLRRNWVRTWWHVLECGSLAKPVGISHGLWSKPAVHCEFSCDFFDAGLARIKKNFSADRA